MVNYTSKLLKGAGIIFTASLFSSALGYLIRITLAKKLTTEEFGLFFAIYNIILLIGWMKGLGLSSTIGKYIPEFNSKKDNESIKSILVFVTIFTFITSLFFLIIFYFFPVETINAYFKSDIAKPIFLVLLIFISIDSFSQILAGYFLATHRYFSYASRDLILRAFVFLALISFIEITILKIALIYIVASVLTLIVTSLFFLNYFHFFKYSSKITKQLIRKSFSFSAPLMIRDIFDILMSYSGNLVLVFFRPLTEIAIYNVILPTADMLLLFTRPFIRIMFPLTSELSAMNQTNQVVFFLRKIHEHLLLILAPIVVFMFLFSKFFLNILFGADYASGYWGLNILCLAYLVTSLNGVTYSVLLGLGKSKDVTKATITSNILNLGLNIILIPIFGRYQQGYFGVVIATLFSSVLLSYLLIFHLRKLVNYSLPWRNIFLFGCISLFLWFIGYIIKIRIDSVYLQIITFTSIGVILYPLLLFLFNITSIKEIKKLINLVLKKGYD